MTRKLTLADHELAGRRRGNTTSGSLRRGNKRGRVRLHPEGTVLYSISLKMTDAECAVAIFLGGGNVAKGVRRALEEASKTIPLPSDLVPLNRFEMEARVKRTKAERRLSRLKAAAGIKDTGDDTSWLDQ